MTAQAALSATFAILLKSNQPLVVEIRADFEDHAVVKDLVETLKLWATAHQRPPISDAEVQSIVDLLDEALHPEEGKKRRVN